MVSRMVKRIAWAAVFLSGAGAFAASVAEARPVVRRTARPAAARGFNLFAGAVNVMMNVNRVQCNINNIGETCVDPTNSPALGGGFWPKGSPNQYIFNGGLQIAGVIGGGGIAGVDTPNFPWPGDTVGAFFFDPRGDQAHGEGRTNVFNSLVASDLAAWPTAAEIRDTSLFHPSLIGRQTVSQQDTWVRMWDGNTNLTTGRQHPMGLLVEQRGLAWNFPSGNQDIVYFLFRFINISARDASRYANLANHGYSGQDIADIVAIANEFQDRAEAAYNVQIPDSGYTIEQVYAAFAQDPDVGNASFNYSSASLPFALGVAYKSDFRETTWQYPPEINGAPFAAAPGFEGVKYLKSPQNIGIAMFGNTTNGNPFPDSRGVQQLWRRISANLSPADGTCSAPNPAARNFCFIGQAPVDTRFFQSSGPLTLRPGESDVIVVAYIHAAPLQSAPAATPGVGAPLSAFSLAPFIGGNMVPGLPTAGDRLVTGLDTVKNFERAAGWLNHSDVNGDGVITQDEVVTAPRSLLNKALVAQAVFDNRFLLPFAPEAPEFYLVPGDNQVTIVWQRSNTEVIGDPYFAIASAPVINGLPNSLYDVNFREFDVEGYRIWRGRSQAQMEIIASFDYSGTEMTDNTGQFFNATDYGNQCAPELGILTTCPVAFNPNGGGPTFPAPLSGDVVQIPPGGRVEQAPVAPNPRGVVLVTTADTAVTGGNSGLPGLTDTGVPFAFVDNGVRNGFRYFYSVTAFDVNSVRSGPSSLESPQVTKIVQPRASSSNSQAAVFVTGTFGGDGTQLDPSLPYPAIDPATGALTGPIPPTNAAELTFLASVAEALPPGDYVARMDSVGEGAAGGFGGPSPLAYVSFIAGADTIAASFDINAAIFNAAVSTVREFSGSLPLVPFDTARARLVGIPQAFAAAGRMPVRFVGRSVPLSAIGSAISLANGRYGATGTTPAARYFSHGYWNDGGAAAPAQATINPFPSASNTHGSLTGVTRIWSPTVYRLPLTGLGGVHVNYRGFTAATIGAWYAANFTITWGAGGSVAVRDSTHRTNLAPKTGLAPGYGFLRLSDLVAAGITPGDVADGVGTPSMAAVAYQHGYVVSPVCSYWWGVTCVPLAQTAELMALDFNSDGVADGNGVVMVINGEVFFFEMAALPAAGTTWSFTARGGGAMTATCTLPTSVATVPASCSGYSYVPPTNRPPWAPGVSYGIRVTAGFQIAAASGSLDRVHTVPDPYYVTNQLENTSNNKILRFVNLPERAIIRIYSASGILVSIVNHNDGSGGGEATWNLRNRNEQFVASGVYFYHVETADGQEKVGRFTVVNFAQ